MTEAQKNEIRERAGIQKMTDEMRAEIADFREKRDEGYLTETEFAAAVEIICTTGWDGADLLTKEYYLARLQGEDEFTAAHTAVAAAHPDWQ